MKALGHRLVLEACFQEVLKHGGALKIVGWVCAHVHIFHYCSDSWLRWAEHRHAVGRGSEKVLFYLKSAGLCEVKEGGVEERSAVFSSVLYSSGFQAGLSSDKEQKVRGALTPLSSADSRMEREAFSSYYCYSNWLTFVCIVPLSTIPASARL